VTFGEPLFLLGLLLLPLGALAYMSRERRARAGREAFAPAALLPSVVPRRAGWRRHAPVIGYGLAAAALVTALSRPQATLAVGLEQATVVVVTDRSGSMLATDVAPNRLLAARAAGASLIESVPDDVRVGAIAFNHSVSILQSPTRDHTAVRQALAGVDAAGSTATGDALLSALRMIADARRPGQASPPAAIILLSDGASMQGRDPVAVAREARRARVPVYTVALGTPDGFVVNPLTGAPQAVPPDPETLRRVARITGGRAFDAERAGDLDAVYERLGRAVAARREPREVTAAFAAGGLLLLAGGLVAALRRRSAFG
jgi:Ca-activated chloride channel family protein